MGSEAVLVCDQPPPPGPWLVGRDLIVSGWAWASSGVERVELVAAGARRDAFLLDAREDVDADGNRAFVAYLDLLLSEPGAHELALTLHGRAGERAEQRVAIVLDPEAAYRQWLSTARPAPAGPAPDAAVGGAARLRPMLAKVARGEKPFAVLLDPHSETAPGAMARLAEAFAKTPAPDLVYADHERVVRGRRVAFAAPGWAPELALAGDLAGPLIAFGPRAARAALRHAVGTRVDARVHELLVALVDEPLRVERVPEPLSLRRRPLPTGRAPEAALAAVARRRGRRARVAGRSREGWRDVRWELREHPPVSVVIPSRYAGRRLDACLRSIRERTSYRSLEVVVVDSSGGELVPAMTLLGDISHRVVPYEGDGPFNFQRAVNLGARAAGGSHLLFLNDDVEVRTGDWIERLVEHAETPGIAIVAGKLARPDGSVQHAGVAVSSAGVPWQPLLGAPAARIGPQGELAVTRDAAAVSAACMLVRRDVFDRVGGFDESLVLDFGDVDFCLRVRALGQRIVVTPRAVLIHHESASRQPRPSADGPRFRERWEREYAAGDPIEHPAFHILAPLMRTGPAQSGFALDLDGMPDDAVLHVHGDLRLTGTSLGPDGPLAPRATLDGEPLPSPEPGEDGAFELAAGPLARGRHELTLEHEGGPARALTVDALPAEPPTDSLEELRARVERGVTAGALDEPRLDRHIEVASRLAVRGWAWCGQGLEAVYVSVDGGPREQATLGAERTDLPGVLGRAELAHAGFELLLDLNGLREGEHRLAVAIVGLDGEAIGVEGDFFVREAPERPLPALDGNGERFVPEQFRGRLIDAEHQTRYRWAAHAVAGREVLDAGCGVGWGSAILARAGAARVVGLDRSPEAILNARERAGELAEFVLGDLRELPFPDASFDVVTSFEAIEHVPDQERALDELRRVLRPDGLLLLSSPNRDVYTPGNPHHVHEYTPDELRTALAGRFANVRLQKQHVHLGSLLGSDDDFESTDAERVIAAELRKVGAARAGELYTLALASDGPLPELPGVAVLGDAFDMREVFELAWAWEDRAIQAEADAEASRIEVQAARQDALRAQDLVEESQAARASAEHWLAELQRSPSWRITAPLRRAKRLLGRR